MSYSNNACSQSTASTCGKASTTQQQPQQQCPATIQLISQAIHLMGPFFPLNKKLNANQIQSVLNKQPKMMFNMFLPIMFTSHTHLNGAICLHPPPIQSTNNNSDYEKNLIESYMPYLTFFDWLCRNTFSRRLAGATSTSTTSTNNSSTAATTSTSTEAASQLLFSTQSTKQLIDLILYTSQQFVLLNISFISYLSNYLAITFENNSASPNTSASFLNANANQQASLNNSEFFNLLVESPYLYSFINTILTDFRYLLSKKEIYEFFQIVLQRFILNIINNDSTVSSLSILGNANAATSPLMAGNHEKNLSSSSSSNKSSSTITASPSPILLTIKSFIERCCNSLNEIRFYFEFQQLSKHLIAAASLKKGESN